MAGHGRTSWDDVAVVTVSILPSCCALRKAKLASRLLFRAQGVGEGCRCEQYRVHAAIGRLVKSGLVSGEALSGRWRPRPPAPFLLRQRKAFWLASNRTRNLNWPRWGSVRKCAAPVFSAVFCRVFRQVRQSFDELPSGLHELRQSVRRPSMVFSRFPPPSCMSTMSPGVTRISSAACGLPLVVSSQWCRRPGQCRQPRVFHDAPYFGRKLPPGAHPRSLALCPVASSIA